MTIANSIIRSVDSKEIFNLEYKVVGFTKDDKAYNIIREFIGDIINGYIVYPDNCYESGEPIYISNNNRAFRFP